jgi:hypothetical protein
VGVLEEQAMNDAGKGSSPRPFSVAHDEWSKRWDAIFQRDLPEGPKICLRCGKSLGFNPQPTDIHTCTPKENQHAKT